MKLRPQIDDPAVRASPRATRWRFALALSGALVVHGLIAVALLRGRAAPVPRRAQAVAVEVRFESVPPDATKPPQAAVSPDAKPADAARAAAAKPSAPSHASTRKEAAIALNRAGSGPASAKVGAKEEAHQVAAPSPAKGTTPPRKRDEAWAAAEGLLLAPQNSKAPLFGVSRTLKDPLAALGPSPSSERPGAGSFDNGFGQGPQGPVHVPSREEALAEEETRVSARVQGWILDAQAFARADPTRDRDGYWQDVQDVLEKGFEPEWALLDSRHGNSTSPAPKAVRVIAEQYMKAAETYGKSGSPMANGPDAPGARGLSMNQDLTGALSADRGLRGTAMDNQMALATQLQNLGGGTASPWLQRLVVHVLLTQRPDGGLEDIKLAGSSGNAVYDALVLGQARKLSAHGLLGAPPKDHRKTIWAFEADFEQAPPMPVAGCGLDVNFVPRDCFYPLKKSVKSRVRLEAVY